MFASHRPAGPGVCSHAPALRHSRRGSVTVMAAVSMMSLIYAGAIAIDLTNVYLTKSVDQRIADQSAIAAAFAYAQNSNSATTAAKEASSLALVNGAGSATVATSIVSSPSGDGENAVMVVVTTNVNLSGFGQATSRTGSGSVAGSGSGSNASAVSGRTIAVSATAYAEIHGGASAPCIIALQSGGYTSTGGVTTTANACAIASNGSVSATSGAKITAQSIYAVGSIGASNGASVTTSPTANQTFPGASAQTDPFSKSNVFSRLSTVAAMTAPMFPSVGSAPAAGSTTQCTGTMTIGTGTYGTITATSYPTCNTLNFSGGGTTIVGGLQMSGPSMTINLAAGTYKFGSFSNTGYGTTTINMTGNVTLYIWGGLSQSGSAAMNFNGTATYYIQGGLSDTSSTAMTFTNTNSASPSTFYVAGGIKIGNGSATFPDGTYVITSGDGTAGIDVGGGDSATFGNGSFQIAGGISTGGGSNLTFGNALYSSSVFQVPTVGSSGNAMNTGGGNTLTIGSFANADFNGPIVIGGSAVTMGAGVYTVNGAVNISSSGGGSITGTGVQVISSGAISFGAGFNAVNFSAPTAITASTLGQFGTVSLASNSSSPFLVTAGASNTNVLGALYAPSAALQLSGAGNLNGGGGCMQVVAGSIALSGGSSMTTTCTSLGSSSSGGAISLVQ